MLPYDPNAVSGPAKEGHSPPVAAAERAVGYPRYGYSDFTADTLDDGLDLRKYLRVIIKRRRLILSVIGVFILLGMIATFLWAPRSTGTRAST